MAHTTQDYYQISPGLRIGTPFSVLLAFDSSTGKAIWIDSVLLLQCSLILKKPLERQLTGDEKQIVAIFVARFYPKLGPGVDLMLLL